MIDLHFYLWPISWFIHHLMRVRQLFQLNPLVHGVIRLYQITSEVNSWVEIFNWNDFNQYDKKCACKSTYWCTFLFYLSPFHISETARPNVCYCQTPLPIVRHLKKVCFWDSSVFLLKITLNYMNLGETPVRTWNNFIHIPTNNLLGVSSKLFRAH